jgi:hypothetical protein
VARLDLIIKSRERPIREPISRVPTSPIKSERESSRSGTFPKGAEQIGNPSIGIGPNKGEVPELIKCDTERGEKENPMVELGLEFTLSWTGKMKEHVSKQLDLRTT